MPRYYFHTANGFKLRDEEGEHLPGLDAAKVVALDVLAEVLPSKAQQLWAHKTFSVYVKDESGRLVAALTTIATLDPVPLPDVPPEI